MTRDVESCTFAVVGGGISGLALACALAESKTLGGRITVVDDRWSDGDDRTLSYFSDEPRAVDALVRRVFQKVTFAAPGIRLDLPLTSYRYRSLRGLDFRRNARARLAANPRVTLLRGHVSRVEDGEEHAELVVDGQTIRADWLFDSRREAARPLLAHHDVLKQRFVGWEIALDRPALDPSSAVLFDFRADPLRFHYLLPFTDRNALVEVVTFGAEASERDLAAYLGEALPGAHYRVLRREGGASLLTTAPFVRSSGGRVIAIGVAGGLLRPSTGYALTRILDDSTSIVAALEAGAHPLARARRPRAYGVFDGVFLHLVATRAAGFPRILQALFSRNPIDRVMRLLDGRASFWDFVRIVLASPKRPFLGALAGWVAVRLGLRKPHRLAQG